MAIIGFLDSTLSGDLAPLDVEADAIIRAYLKRHPDAAYHLTMRAMSAVAAAAPKAEAGAEPAAPREQKSWLSGIFERRLPAVS